MHRYTPALLGLGLFVIAIASGWYFFAPDGVKEVPETPFIAAPEATVPATNTAAAVTAERPGASSGPENEVRFVCEGDKSLTAVFTRDIAGVTLSDGRQFTLRESPDAPARYEDAYRGIVFWGAADKASLEEGGVTTYRDCRIDV